MNVALKTRIFERHTTQRELCQRLGISQFRMSGFITGRSHPTQDERRKIARALKSTIGHLFNAVKNSVAA